MSLRNPSTPLEITNWLLHQPPPYSRGLIVNRPAHGMSHAGRLFQAAMWRKYAADWSLPNWHIRHQWIEKVGRVSRAECVRRARVNLYLARRLRRPVTDTRPWIDRLHDAWLASDTLDTMPEGPGE